MDDRRNLVNRFSVCQLMIVCAYLASRAVIADGDIWVVSIYKMWLSRTQVELTT